MITTDLREGERYDLILKSGQILKGWYLYDKKCGYFTKKKDRQTAGFIYSESVKSAKESL